MPRPLADDKLWGLRFHLPHYYSFSPPLSTFCRLWLNASGILYNPIKNSLIWTISVSLGSFKSVHSIGVRIQWDNFFFFGSQRNLFYVYFYTRSKNNILSIIKNIFQRLWTSKSAIEREKERRKVLVWIARQHIYVFLRHLIVGSIFREHPMKRVV